MASKKLEISEKKTPRIVKKLIIYSTLLVFILISIRYYLVHDIYEEENDVYFDKSGLNRNRFELLRKISEKSQVKRKVMLEKYAKLRAKKFRKLLQQK